MGFDLPVPPQFSRPNWAQIDLDALRHNARILARHAAPARLVAVIKAGAYGHGALPIAQALTEVPEVAMLGVASVDEAQKLRDGGITTPVLLLSAILPEEAAAVVRLNLVPTVWAHEVAAALQDEAERVGVRVALHFKVDTGMGRLGVLSQDAVRAYNQIRAFPNLQMVGVYTHFASADEDVESTSAQIRRFEEFCATVELPAGTLKHASNSAGVLRFPQANFDLVRPGIALHGVAPCETVGGALDLQPVMTWKARVTNLKQIPKGQSVSYGATWTAERESRIAVIPVGYADGYMRSLSNRGEVLVKGQRCPVVGRVTMDQIILDVTDLGDEVHIGDEVTLWGRDLPVEEVAERAGTIPWELLCAVSARVPRVYLSGSP